MTRARRLLALFAAAVSTGAALAESPVREMVARAVQRAEALTGLERRAPVRYERVALDRLREIVVAETARTVAGDDRSALVVLEGLRFLPSGFPLEEALRDALVEVPPAFFDRERGTLAVAPALLSDPRAPPLLVRAAVQALLAQQRAGPAGHRGWDDALLAREAAFDAVATLACQLEAGSADTVPCLQPVFAGAPTLVVALDRLKARALAALRARFERAGRRALRESARVPPAATVEFSGGASRHERAAFHRDGARSLGPLAVQAWLAGTVGAEPAASIASAWAGDRVVLEERPEGRFSITWRTRWSGRAAAGAFASAAERELRAPGAEWRLMVRGEVVEITVDAEPIPAEDLGAEPWEGVRFGGRDPARR